MNELVCSWRWGTDSVNGRFVHGRWDSVNWLGTPRRNRLREWTRTSGDCRVEDKKERDGANHHVKLGLREFCVRVNLPSPIWQGRVPIRRVITPIRGVPNPIRQAVRMISHICSYPPHCSSLHPPSLSFLFTTLPSSLNTKLSHPSLSLHSMIMSWHRVQHSSSTTYTEYSIHRVDHTPGLAYTEYSIHQVRHPPKIVFLPFMLMITSWPLNVASASSEPPYIIDCHHLARHESSKVKSPCHIPTFVSPLTDE